PRRSRLEKCIEIVEVFCSAFFIDLDSPFAGGCRRECGHGVVMAGNAVGFLAEPGRCIQKARHTSSHRHARILDAARFLRNLFLTWTLATHRMVLLKDLDLGLITFIYSPV